MSTETVENETAATDEVEAPATPVKEPKVPVKCKCGLYSKIVGEGDSAVLDELVPCTATTNGNFAPGHDAKLKSQLIKLGATDIPVYKNVDGEDVEMSAQDAANEYGFGPKVADGIARAKSLLADKAAKAEVRDTKKAQAEADKAAKKEEAAAKKADREAEAAAKKAAKKAEADAAKAAKAAAQAATTPAEADADANGSDDESLF
jgi:hypothetical protein